MPCATTLNSTAEQARGRGEPARSSRHAAGAYLRIEGVCKRFGEAAVLEDVHLEIEQGGCLALLGPSGCGKSTLLNIIAGFERPDRGRVVCGDRLLSDADRGAHLAVHRRGLGMVFQDLSLWPHMTAAQNVAFGLRVAGVRRAERRRRVAEALERVQMSPWANQYPGRLSGGQQQRVAIARSLVVQPAVLLLDEPLSALDVQLRASLRDELAALLNSLNMTAVYVTHDQTEGFALADRVAVMRTGRIEQVGTPEQLYRDPASAFVAGFVSGANVCAFSARATHLTLEGGSTLELSVPPPSGAVCFALRPESIAVAAAAATPQPQAGRLLLTGRCESTRFLGQGYEAVVAAGPGLRLRGLSSSPIAPGQPVSITFKEDQIQWLFQ